VYLLDTPLDNTYKNEIFFTSKTEQTEYFSSKIKHSFEGVTYQRKNNVARVEAHIDYLWDSNYVMYQNTNFGGRWFFAFITKMEYISDRATDIYLETDVFQTWLFDCTLKESFVVREHVSDDTIGAHLVEENLEFGDYIMESYEASEVLGDNWNILAVSDNSPLGNTEQIGNLYGQVVTGLTYFPFPNTTLGIAWLKETIKKYVDAGKIDAIVMIFTVPELIIKPTINDSNWYLGFPMSSGDPYGFHSFSVSKRLSSLNGYVPKNKKMYTYPYKFFYVSNNSGQSATYRYEDFNYSTDPSKMQFEVFGSINPSPKVMMAPSDYKGDGLKYEYGLVLEGYPLASWNADTYAAWLASNGASTAVSMIGSAGALIGGIATGNLLATGGGALAIAHELTQLRQAVIQPDQAKGQIGNGNIMYGTGSLDFYFAHMTIKAEFAKRIDDFFSMYGYKVNSLKVPNRHSRQRWNYIQTIDINIDGSIPSDDMVQLKKVYDNGVTLWHNPSDFLNYNLSNPII
jgi:hypothetical protein